MSQSNSQQNILKGVELEDSVHEVFRQLGYNVEVHKVTDSGVDSNATKGRERIIAECLNWYGGFIHPLRWLSITDNLLSHPNATAYLICVGVYPTADQYDDLVKLHIHLVYGDTVADCTRDLMNQMKGVITIEPEDRESAPLSSYYIVYPFSSYGDLELDFWNSLARSLNI